LTEIWELDATGLAARIRAGEISAREAARAALARLDAVNPLINAVVDHRPDDVLRQADGIDRALAAGEALGPLAGVPVTVKVNADQAGYATTNGTILQKDMVAAEDGSVVANLRRAGAVILGRTNTPAFSLRWFTSNLLHGETKNPRDPALTPGGSSGGAAASVAAGIGHLAHGTDIAGSIRYPAYACGVHGLRPSLGRVANYNPSGPERGIGAQLTAVAGPIGRTIADLRLGLAVLAAPDHRDVWWVPAPLEGPLKPRHAAVCLRPAGMTIAPEVATALLDAANRLRSAGWTVEQLDDLPPLREAADLQAQLWLGADYESWLDLATRDGDPGALAALQGVQPMMLKFDSKTLDMILRRRATLTRQWQLFMETYPIVLLPVSGELGFPDQLDRQGNAGFQRVWQAQLTQLALPFLGLPALASCTRLAGTTPVGVQILSGRFREDLCLDAAAAIESYGVPPSPVSPSKHSTG
jgi:amidase